MKSITLTCKTNGFTDGTNGTTAVWGNEEQICLFRSEDWRAGAMSIASGAGSATAKFKGRMVGTEKGYYAVRPLSAASAVKPNGETVIEVEPNNIFFAEENSAVVTPQVGVGSSRGLTFNSIFGALKFEVSDIVSTSLVEVTIPNKERGLYGTFEYNFKQGKCLGDEVEYEVKRRDNTPINLAGCIYVAMPAGEYESVELVVRNEESGRKLLYIAEGVEVKQGALSTVQGLSSTLLSPVVGSWRIESFGGASAVADLYMEFLRNGNFVILQRTDGMGYKRYEGTYNLDEANGTISGVYSDGESWSNSYKYSLNNFKLVLESTASSSEISVYESSDMPKVISPQSISLACAEDIKPL